VEIEQVEVTKLLGVTLDCKQSWSKHIDTTVTKMGRSMSMIKRCSTFLTALSTRQVLQALVSTFLTALSTRQVLQALVSTFLTALSTRQVLQALVSTFLTALSTRQVLVLSHLFSRVVRCHKKGFRKIAISAEQGSTAGELILIICMSISPVSKRKRD
jgi:hypothetical protein